MSEFKVGDKVYCDLFDEICTVVELDKFHEGIVTIKRDGSEGSFIGVRSHYLTLENPSKLPVKHGWLNYKGGTYA